MDFSIKMVAFVLLFMGTVTANTHHMCYCSCIQPYDYQEPTSSWSGAYFFTSFMVPHCAECDSTRCGPAKLTGQDQVQPMVHCFTHCRSKDITLSYCINKWWNSEPLDTVKTSDNQLYAEEDDMHVPV